jgi:hypothetical protein
VLFSNENVAQFINTSFEPMWESVRPVPIVRIDFGDGNVITRTLHGNIASFVCFADGEIIDVLPGIYEPTSYRAALTRIRNVAENLRGVAVADRTRTLANYHTTQAEALKKGQPAAHILEQQIAMLAITKVKIERPIENVVAVRLAGAAQEPKPDMPAEDLANWKALEEDTRLNENARRQVIHAKLATTGAIPPAALTKWLYKEVLHADLDDPYLGLGKTLFASYPFASEDK